MTTARSRPCPTICLTIQAFAVSLLDAIVLVVPAVPVAAQLASQPARPPSCIPAGFAPPIVIYRSTEQVPDGRVTFRICTPDATTAAVTSSVDP